MSSDNELSYSNTVLTVYIISGIIFVLLVLSLFIMGLAPIASCCRYWCYDKMLKTVIEGILAALNV